MEFREYSNPESADYDLKANGGVEPASSYQENPYYEQMFDLIGILEDIEEDEIMATYGITLEEYLHPTATTIAKIKLALANEEKEVSGKVK